VYGRGSPGIGFGPPVTPDVIKYLLIANIGVFLLQNFFASTVIVLPGGLPAPVIDGLFAVRPYLVFQFGYVWQPATYMWLHGGLAHVALNMFVLWMFGSQLALAWGPRRFFRFYLVCGIGAGVIIAAAPYLFYAMGVPRAIHIPTVGASGAIYGVMLAYSLTWPDRTIMLIFPPVAFRAIWLIPIIFFMTIFFGGSNISHVGHLGGVVVGWLYLRRRGGPASGAFSVKQLRNRWHRYRMRQKLRAIRYEDHERRRDDERRLH
jgi:membrane associated rhomboid family serine protease